MTASDTGAGPPPQSVVMRIAMGAWACQTLSTLARLDVPDLLQRHGALSARQLVSEHGVDARPELLERALRACASIGIFSEDAEGRFGPTALSEVLTRDAPGSVKKFLELFGGSWWQMWSGLPEALRTGEPQSKPQLGREFWNWCSGDPKRMEDFGEAMRSNASSLRGAVAHCDLSGARRLVDVGGGFGHAAIALLERYPRLSACVLELPELVAIAERRAAGERPEVRARLSFAGGDMFDGVPPADAYLLKHVLHDWDDARCVRLLRNCRARLGAGGRIWCLDAVLPPLGDTAGAPAKWLDMSMLVFNGGKERTEPEWRALCGEADLEVASMTRIEGSDDHVVEAAAR